MTITIPLALNTQGLETKCWSGEVQREATGKQEKRDKPNHGRFTPCFHGLFLHFLDFFKLANTLDPRKIQKQKKWKQSHAYLCDLYTALTGSVLEWLNESGVCFSLLSIWSRACFLLQFLVIWACWWLFCFYAAILYRMKLPQPPPKKEKILKMRGYVERVPRDPFQKRVSVFIWAWPTLRT